MAAKSYAKARQQQFEAMQAYNRALSFARTRLDDMRSTAVTPEQCTEQRELQLLNDAITFLQAAQRITKEI